MTTPSMKRRMVLDALAVGALAPALTSPAARAQSAPDRPLRVVVPFAGGNTLDTALRQLAGPLKRESGQTLVIDNRPGGSGAIAAAHVAQSPADGSTLLLSNISILAINPHTHARLAYDVKAFRPVTGFLGASLALAVNENVPARNVAEFIAWTKARPGKVSYASFTPGGAAHFAGAILNEKAGLDMVHVGYSGTPPAVQNLVGGQVDAAFLPPLAVRPYLESGKVRVLAVSSTARSPMLPNVATFTEQGFPDLQIFIWSGLSAPVGTPDAAIASLNAAFTKVLRSEEIRDAWRAFDFQPMPMTAKEFGDYTAKESVRWGEAVRLTGFKAQE